MLILNSPSIKTQISSKSWSITTINMNRPFPLYVIFFTFPRHSLLKVLWKATFSTPLGTEREAQSSAFVENSGMQSTANLRGWGHLTKSLDSQKEFIDHPHFSRWLCKKSFLISQRADFSDLDCSPEKIGSKRYKMFICQYKIFIRQTIEEISSK